MYMSFFQKYNFPVAERENLLENLRDSELSGRLVTSDMCRNFSAALMCSGLVFLTLAPELVNTKDQLPTTVAGTFFLLSGYALGEAYVADARAVINVAKSRGLEILKKPFFRHIDLDSGN